MKPKNLNNKLLKQVIEFNNKQTTRVVQYTVLVEDTATGDMLLFREVLKE